MTKTYTSRTSLVFDTATSICEMKNMRERAQFEAFNPHGLLAQKKRNDDIIGKLVDDKIVPVGWELAYGFASGDDKQLLVLACKQRVSGRDLRVAQSMMQQHLQLQEKKIAEVTEV
tara:strand:- start:511 stop:858 length:348 start_codon:yes stop_codon:yes gene_type:complete